MKRIHSVVVGHDHEPLIPGSAEPDSSLLFARVRALFPTKEVLLEHVQRWEKGAPWSLLNDQWEAVRRHGFSKEGIAIALKYDPDKGKCADIVILLPYDKNVRFRYYFSTSTLEPYYHRLF